MTEPDLDPVSLEVWWSRLAAITDEAATLLMSVLTGHLLDRFPASTWRPPGSVLNPVFPADCTATVDPDHNLIIDIGQEGTR